MSNYFDEQRKKLKAIMVTALCLASTSLVLNIVNLSVTISNYNNKNKIKDILETDANIKIHDDVISSIKMEARVTSDGGCGALTKLKFYYNYDIKDTGLEIPAYEIIYEVNDDTFEYFKENFNKASLKQKRKMIEELAKNYDPTKVVDNVQENNNGLSY